MKGKPIETAIGRIEPSMGAGKDSGDKTTTGKPINAGVIFMTMQGGTASFKHKGRKVKIGFTTIVPTGALLLRAPNGRQFVLNIEKVIRHAIDNGLLDPDLKFEPVP